MNLLDQIKLTIANWLHPPRPKQLAIVGDGKFKFEVVGEASYQVALEQICGAKTEDGHNYRCVVTLIFDDANRYDKNAVRVVAGGNTVGYLPRDAAKQFRKNVATLGISRSPLLCRGVIKGGWDRGEDDTGNFGIWLDVTFPLGTREVA